MATLPTLPDGTAVSSGERGGVHLGGAGAYQPGFTHHMFLSLPPEGDLAPPPPDGALAPPPPEGPPPPDAPPPPDLPPPPPDAPSVLVDSSAPAVPAAPEAPPLPPADPGIANQ